MAATLTLGLLLLGCSRNKPESSNEGIESIQLGQRGTVFCLAFSPDSKYLAVSSNDMAKGFVVSDVESQTEVFSAEGRIDAIAFSPDGKTMALDGQLWAVSSPDVEKIAVGTRVTFWDTTTWKEQKRPAITDWGLFLAFHPKEDLLFVAGWQLLLWDLKADKARYRKEPHKFSNAFALSPDGSTLVLGAETGKVWEAATGKELWSFVVPPSTEGATSTSVSCAAFLPDGGTFATGGGANDGKVRLWDLKARKEKAVFSGELYRCEALAVSPGGKIIVVAGAVLGDVLGLALVEFWDVSTGKRLAKLNVPYVGRVALSPDGKWLATGTSNGMKKGGPNEPGVVELWKMAEVLGKQSK